MAYWSICGTSLCAQVMRQVAREKGVWLPSVMRCDATRRRGFSDHLPHCGKRCFQTHGRCIQTPKRCEVLVVATRSPFVALLRVSVIRGGWLG